MELIKSIKALYYGLLDFGVMGFAKIPTHYGLIDFGVWMLADEKQKIHEGSLLPVNDRVGFLFFYG